MMSDDRAKRNYSTLQKIIRIPRMLRIEMLSGLGVFFYSHTVWLNFVVCLLSCCSIQIRKMSLIIVAVGRLI